MALTKNENKMVRAAEQNRESAKILLQQCFECYGTDFCLRQADSAFTDCREAYAQEPQLDEYGRVEMVIMLLGAAALVEIFSEFRARGNSDES